jgi:hypothetical protein
MSQVAEFDHNQFSSSRQAEADKGLLVKFFMLPRQDKAATELAGRPIFKDVEHVDIKIPGNRNSGACRPATEADKRRFPNHYRAFKERIENVEEGTPLTEWPLMSRSMAEELAFFRVKTVEQLVTMSDSQSSKFMGLNALKEKARLWLKSAEQDKPFQEMDKKIKDQAEEIAELREALAMVVARAEQGKTDPNLNEKQNARAKTRAVKLAKEIVS